MIFSDGFEPSEQLQQRWRDQAHEIVTRLNCPHLENYCFERLANTYDVMARCLEITPTGPSIHVDDEGNLRDESGNIFQKDWHELTFALPNSG